MAGGVVLAALQDDRVQGAVELARHAHGGQSLDESHAARRHQAGDGLRQTDPSSLTVA